MAGLAALRHRLTTLVRGARLRRELDEEMQLHVTLRRERLESEGFTREAAQAAAARRFGNHLRVREASVDE